MFFIMGISQGERKLPFDELAVCRYCGKYGHIEIIMTYTYLSLFFIPLFKWNKHYYARMTCCGHTFELDPEQAGAAERGEPVVFGPDFCGAGRPISGPETDNIVNESGRARRECRNCGFTTDEDFSFCPK